MKPFAIQKDAGVKDFADWETFTPARGESDYCSRDGAMALKATIEAYWRQRGQDVIVALHNVGFHPAIRAARYDVRSDMLNGMPRHTRNMKHVERAAPEDIVEIDDDLVFE